MTPAIIASAETMLEKWKSREGKEIEVFEEFKLLTSEVIARTAFGSNYLEGKNIFEMLRKLADLIAINHLKLRFPWMRLIYTFFLLTELQISEALFSYIYIYMYIYHIQTVLELAINIYN